MKISLKWINEFVDIKDYFSKPEALAALLTGAGLEVEEIQNKAKDFDHVVIGQILKKDKHPDADKLSLCQVTTGEGVVHQIVCGAKNHNADDKVIVALPGAVLPGNFAIKKGVIRGVESGGMLCSYKELGMATESEGIAILPVDAKIGESFAKYGGYDDVSFELKVTPNRADCLSHYGLAREISCLLDRPIKSPVTEVVARPGLLVKEFVKLESPQKELCPRYAGRLIRGVKVGPSPVWLKQRLETVGINSINNVVDITNYIMLEMGQPLHAFDLREIDGKAVIVDRAQAGEKFTTLDGSEITLKGDELMIRNANRSMCMAGVIGGKDSGIKDSTVDVFLESAYFAAQSIRKSSRSHGIVTDSAYRFSRGVDPRHAIEALNRACRLIVEVAGGEVSEDFYDLSHSDFALKPIRITTDLISRKLGYECEEKKFETFMIRLGCQVKKIDNVYEITPPSWRFDIEMDMDLVEEYARLNGYDKIPESLPKMETFPTAHDSNYIWPQVIAQIMTGESYSQAVNFAFTGEAWQKEFVGNIEDYTKTGLKLTATPVKLLNPLNDQLNVMRTSLLPALAQNMFHNFHHGVSFGNLFEVGSSFSKEDGKYVEYGRLAGVSWGQPLSLWGDSKAAVVMRVKTTVENLLGNLGFKSWEWLKASEAQAAPSFLHRGQMAVLKLEGQKIGFIGTLHPVLLDDKKIRSDVAVFELDLSALMKGQPRAYKVAGVSKMPVVERDLALVMPKSLSSGQVRGFIKKTAGQILKSVEDFDLYEGEKLEAGLKSITYRLRLQHEQQTLTDAEVTGLMERLIKGLDEQYQVRLR